MTHKRDFDVLSLRVTQVATSTVPKSMRINLTRKTKYFLCLP